jgi:hypothetical protein
MERKPNQGTDGGWESSTHGDKAWQAETDRIAARNADARKAGRVEREEYEKGRDEARRAVAAKQRAELLKRHGS